MKLKDEVKVITFTLLVIGFITLVIWGFINYGKKAILTLLILAGVSFIYGIIRSAYKDIINK